ncbi:PREDICTED: uncharacterized protein LOC108368208 [Rhagoletis zephyria]|uniref:uncharacterized protein LOC108368208 n=1 Tax=Rhagoletis zephyria TaxID=28612 RepID=UPI00081141F1|nr:PREDICTED: uncharacterized protein LOC108368208 [Rhagoletis zephyria]
MDPLDVEMYDIHGSQSPVTDVNASIDISENTAELDQALIQYVTTSSRLLFAEREETWNDFHTASWNNTEKFTDYSTEQLREHFLQKVLPKIQNYELTATQMQMFELLKLQPEYERSSTGYVRMPANRRIGFNRQPKEGKDFILVKQTRQLRQMLNECSLTEGELDANQEFDLNKPEHSPTHTLLLRAPYERQGTGYNYQFSKENAALLSAALSNDFELFGRVLIEPKEIHKRLRDAKRDFEQTARMPENCLDAEKLVAKIKKLKTLREAIVDVVTSRF